MIVIKKTFLYKIQCPFSHLLWVLLFLIFNLFQAVARGGSNAISCLIRSVTLGMLQLNRAVSSSKKWACGDTCLSGFKTSCNGHIRASCIIPNIGMTWHQPCVGYSSQQTCKLGAIIIPFLDDAIEAHKGFHRPEVCAHEPGAVVLSQSQAEALPL